MIAWFALGLSVVGLGWQIITFVRDRPLLGVLTRYDGTVVVGGEPEFTWHITIINYGRRPQGITDIGLDGEDRSYSTAVSTLRSAGVEVTGPSFPERIEPHEYRDWIVPHDAMKSQFPVPGQKVRAYVARFGIVYRYGRLNRLAERVRRRGGRTVGFVRDYERSYKAIPN
jgi:hypothetical protein